MTRTRALDGLVLAALAAYPLLAPGYLDLGARMAILALCAMSLDLLVGYCGLVMLGHAAFFGVGAYASGIFAIRAWNEPLAGLVVGAIAAALLALAVGPVLLRSRRLTLIMLTLATVLLVQEAANKLTWLTGGADGLQGIEMGAVAGVFAFDLFGRVSYAYAAVVLALACLVFRMVIDSRFGQSLVGIRENEARMHAIGAPVDARLQTTLVLSAALAGVAGALQAQVSEFVALNAVSVEFSGEILIMLILGGAGRRYGALVGAPVYVFMQDYLAREDPTNWYLWIGLMLLAVVFLAPGGLVGTIGRIKNRSGRSDRSRSDRSRSRSGERERSKRERPERSERSDRSDVLVLQSVSKRFGALDVVRGVSLTLERGARHALIGPNGAGKTTLINLISGRLVPDSGEIWIEGRNATASPEASRVKAGIGRTFQITSLFRRLTIEQNIALAVAERLEVAGRLKPDRAVQARIDRRVAEIMAMLRLAEHGGRPVEVLPYGVQRIGELAVALALEPTVLLLDEPAAGVPRGEVGLIFEAVERLPSNMAVLLIEHDVDVVFRFASRVTVLVAGEIYAEGTPQEISAHAGVRALYLGEAGSA